MHFLTVAATIDRHKIGIAANPLMTTRGFHQRYGCPAAKTAVLSFKGLGFHPIGMKHVMCLSGCSNVGVSLLTFFRQQSFCHVFDGLEPGMSAVYKLKQSRDNWKQKAIARGEQERVQRKEKARLKKERDRHKKEVKQLRGQWEAERHKSTLAAPDKAERVYLALQLFTVARIGFRAVSRVLGVLSPYLGFSKGPCPQTIINWVTRLSRVKLQQVAAFSESSAQGFLWMIDISIGLGAGKILSVLALDLKHHQGHARAPTLQEAHCVAVAVSPSWTGENIAAFLHKVMAVAGSPAGFLKDGGTDLGKSVYADHPMLDIFLSACGKVSTRLKQTVLACLAPPKVSVKARFMNLHRLVRWADRLLKQSPPRAAYWQGCATNSRSCPCAKILSIKFFAMPYRCWPAKKFSKPTGSMIRHVKNAKRFWKPCRCVRPSEPGSWSG